MTKDNSKRKLLKSFAAGSGAIIASQALPEQWAEPVIDTVILPAHAETTEELPTYSYWDSAAVASGVGEIVPPSGVAACVIVIGDMATVTWQGSNNNLRRTASVALSGTPGTATIQASSPGCSDYDSAKDVHIINHTPGVAVSFGVRNSGGNPDRGFDVTIKPGTCGSFQTLDGDCNTDG